MVRDALHEANGDVLLSIAGATKRFGATLALDQVDFEVRAGEIRGLIGRNGAGKSTLVKIASGSVRPDAGEVTIQGRDVTQFSRVDWRKTVGMVYQHSALVESLTVTENVFLGNFPAGKAGLLAWRDLHRKARRMLADWGLSLDVEQPVGTLSLADRQLIEIVRELARGARVVILDEPTSRLPKREIAELHDHVRRLRASGAAIVYISHHLSEVMELCDTVTVLRDGRHVATRDVGTTDEPRLIGDMVGESDAVGAPGEVRRDVARVPDETPLLSLRGFACGEVGPVDLDVRPGEVLGIAGLIGSGKEVVGTAMGGHDPGYDGSILVRGQAVVVNGVRRAMELGIAYVPPDRHAAGLVLEMNVGENVTMAIWPRLASATAGFIGRDVRDRHAAGLVRTGGVVTSGLEQPVGELSGGNQQKVALMRSIAIEPDVLVLMNPTTGVDVASKEGIYRLIEKQRALGKGIVLISDELNEYTLCDRVCVMFQGQVTKVIDHAPDSEQELVAAVEGIDRDEHVETN